MACRLPSELLKISERHGLAKIIEWLEDLWGFARGSDLRLQIHSCTCRNRVILILGILDIRHFLQT